MALPLFHFPNFHEICRLHGRFADSVMGKRTLCKTRERTFLKLRLNSTLFHLFKLPYPVLRPLMGKQWSWCQQLFLCYHEIGWKILRDASYWYLH